MDGDVFTGLYLAIQIHAVGIRECSLGLMIQDRYICYLDHIASACSNNAEPNPLPW